MKKNKQFYQQYKRKLSFNTIGGSMNMRKIVHKNPKIRKTMILIPGWCESFGMMRPIAIEFACLGYDVIVLDYQHLDNGKSLKDELKHLPDLIPKNEYAKALALVHFIKQEQLSNISIVAHSEGSIIASLATWIDTRPFSQAILVAPAGLIREKSFRNLFAKFIYSIYNQDKINFKHDFWLQLRYNLEVILVLIKNPIQSFSDGRSMSNHDVRKQILESCNNGLDVNFIFNIKDALFPINELKEITSDMCKSKIYSLPGGHNDMYIHPSVFVSLVHKIIK